MENEINDIDDLIGKVLTGEASAEERTRLEAWSTIHSDNEKYVAQVRAIFEKAASTKTAPDFDADAAWNKMKARMNGTLRGVTITQSGGNSLWPVIRIAASIALFIAVGIYAYQLLAPPVETFALTTQKAVAQDTLPDGSKAFLNKRSSITYEYNPRQKIRKVKLKGEGFFDVKHEEARPFIIDAEEVLIRDIGTSFNVKAWPESDTVEVIVESGEVQIYTLDNAGLALKAGETGVYNRQNRSFTRLEKPDANARAYQTGELTFVNENLKNVVEKINEVYDSRIRLENPALETCRLTVSFHHDTIDTIVDVIAETMKLSVVRSDKEILLSGKGCN